MPAIVHDDFIFVHIPKCGGTSISEWIPYGTHVIGHPKLESLITPDKKKFTFTIVRNPWDRTVSAYHYLFKTKKITNFQSYIDNNTLTFEQFVKDLKNVKVPELWFNGETQQCEWFRSGIDLIIKYENMEEDVKRLFSGSVDTPLPHEHKSEHSHYREYYTDETREIISTIFKEDIEMFHYEY